MKTRAPSRGRAARLAGLVAAATLAATLLPGTPPVSAVPTPDPDRTSTTPTGWGWHPNASTATITDYAAQGNRIIDLEPTSGTPTFTATYAQNSGTYARGWWWYYNLTAAEVNAKVTEHGARVIDLEQYTTGRGAVRYAVVLVHNADPANKGWGMHFNVTPATISSYVSSNNMRIVDLDRTPSGGFNAVYISNTGVDAKQWWYYYGQTEAQVGNLLRTNQARLTDIERTSDGKFDVVMQKSGGEGWWWLTGATQTQVNELQTQTGSRIYKSSSFVSGGQRLYDVLLIDNTDKETRRIRNAVSSNAIGQWGFYAKRVGGPQLTGLNHETKFEPASMIKILHAVHMLRDVQLNPSTINTNVTWYAHPSYPARYPGQPGYSVKEGKSHKDVCGYDSSGQLYTNRTYSDPMGTIIEQMLVYSDNRTTDAVVRRYGFDALNQTRVLAGMTNSDLNHRIGCPAAASPQPYESNVLTLVDAGKIYEGVERGTLLDNAHADLLYDRMWGWDAPKDATRTMILKEAAAVGLTAEQQVQFADGIKRRAKGGSYGFCRNNACTQRQSISTDGGIVWVPVKGRGGLILSRAYVHGRFLDTHDSYNCMSTTDGSYGTECGAKLSDFVRKIDLEVMRTIVRDALKTWVA
jgi:hypothetical protein